MPDKPTTLLEREPAQVSGAGLSAAVAAACLILRAYGVVIPDGVEGAFVTLGVSLLPYATSLAIRWQVWSPARVAEIAYDAESNWASGYAEASMDAELNAQLIRELQAKVDELTAKEAA